MAHQMNLIFGEIFKESELHQRISKEVIRIVSFFHNSTFFTGNLRDEQKRKLVIMVILGHSPTLCTLDYRTTLKIRDAYVTDFCA